MCGVFFKSPSIVEIDRQNLLLTMSKDKTIYSTTTDTVTDTNEEESRVIFWRRILIMWLHLIDHIKSLHKSSIDRQKFITKSWWIGKGHMYGVAIKKETEILDELISIPKDDPDKEEE